MVHVHVVLVVDTNLGFFGGVPHQDVGIRAGGDDAFLRIHAKHACWRGGAGFYPTLERNLAEHHTLIDEFHSVFDATHAVGNLGEVAKAQFFLILHAERAMVGRHDCQLVHAQALPQVSVVVVMIVL